MFLEVVDPLSLKGSFSCLVLGTPCPHDLKMVSFTHVLRHTGHYFEVVVSGIGGTLVSSPV